MGTLSRLALGVLCAFAAVTMSEGSAKAYCRAGIDTLMDPCIETDAPRLFWPRSCVSYAFDNKAFQRLPAFSEKEVRDIADTSFATWTDIDCGTPPFFVEQLSNTTDIEPVSFSLDEPNQFVLSILTPQEWSMLDGVDDDGIAFAITFLWHDKNTGEIFDVDMALNLSIGDFGRCDTPCTDGTIDLQNTLTHEAGHVFGLGHSMLRSATMYPDATPGANFMRSLESDDEAGFCTLDLPSHDCSGGSACTCPPPAPIRQIQQVNGCALSPQKPPAMVGWPVLFLSLALLSHRRASRARAARERRARAAKTPPIL